jgi:hypothetical protein
VGGEWELRRQKKDNRFFAFLPCVLLGRALPTWSRHKKSKKTYLSKTCLAKHFTLSAFCVKKEGPNNFLIGSFYQKKEDFQKEFLFFEENQKSTEDSPHLGDKSKHGLSLPFSSSIFLSLSTPRSSQ